MEFSKDQKEAFKAMYNHIVNGEKTWTESPEFKSLLNDVKENQEKKKPVTKEEIDWLVDRLANIDAMAQGKEHLTRPILEQIEHDRQVQK